MYDEVGVVLLVDNEYSILRFVEFYFLMFMR